MIFIDADKPSNPEYFAWALKLSRRGSLIIADNVVRNGSVIEANSDDPSVQGVRRFNELLASEPRVSATAIQTVGNKAIGAIACTISGYNNAHSSTCIPPSDPPITSCKDLIPKTKCRGKGDMSKFRSLVELIRNFLKVVQDS
ncbi:hypothetical protein [Nostoc sphaeroides]|uniref:O-methyltransferase n=1 Tax=Nostoc sphaeroides TaxID=446679 RepID=UPI002B3FFC9C|nr:hypothetical protein [Nostoc sphaeroides]